MTIDLSKLLTMFLTLSGLTGLVTCTTGCGQTSGERLQVVDKAIEIMQKHDVAYTGTVTLGGRPSVGASTDFYLDADVTAQFSIQGNAASEGDE